MSDEATRVVVREGDDTWHDGPGWYYWEEEYPDEGSCGSFTTRTEAILHAGSATPAMVVVP